MHPTGEEEQEEVPPLTSEYVVWFFLYYVSFCSIFTIALCSQNLLLVGGTRERERRVWVIPQGGSVLEDCSGDKIIDQLCDFYGPE